MPAASATRPISPSSASISRTRWPLPRPPIAGLQDIAPTVAKRWVTSATLAPMRAAAAAASQPAWPPPTTTTSYCEFIIPNFSERRASTRPRAERPFSQATCRSNVFHVKRRHRTPLTPLCPSLLADTKIPEDHVENIFHVHSPQKLAQRPGRQAKLLRHDFLAAVLRGALRSLQREHCFFEMRPVTLARHQRGLRRKEALGKARDCVNQFIHTGACLAGNKV